MRSFQLRATPPIPLSALQVLIFDRSVGRVVQLSVVEDYGLMLLRSAGDIFRWSDRIRPGMTTG